MQEKKILHTRTQFQIDRLAFFSDAVIAIAITILVLEIKIPEVGSNISWTQIKIQYGNKLLMQLIPLFVCFITIGNLWLRHHELFEHIINYQDVHFLTTTFKGPDAV